MIGVFFAFISMIAIAIGIGSLIFNVIPPMIGFGLICWLGGMGTAIAIAYLRTISKKYQKCE